MNRSELLDRIEPALSWAREASGANDANRAREAIAACAAFLVMYRQANYAEYQPALVLEPLYTAMARRHGVDATFESVPPSIGDPEQVAAVAAAFLENIELDRESRLVVELFHEADVTALDVNLDGPGRFADPVWLAGVVPVARDELAERWTYATRGGRIDPAPNGYSLRITGVRKPPEWVPELEPLLHLLQSAADPGEIVQAVLPAIDDAPSAAPGDLRALLDGIVLEERDALERQRIEIQRMIEPNLPAIVVKRSRLRMFFQSLLRCAAASMPSGGAVAIVCDYDAGERVVGVLATLVGRTMTFDPQAYGASMRRAIVEAHGGTIDIEPDKSGATIVAAVPDVAGRTLDRWLPGWGAFSARSQQMLRLLKSGGQAPPEEFILAGVLEEELERWLLPQFAEPLAMNVAGELPVQTAAHPGASAERLKKAVEQIRKGKVKKEIAQPGYAAEILWAARNDTRHRSAFGAEKLTADDLENLAAYLWHKPVNSLEALRILGMSR